MGLYDRDYAREPWEARAADTARWTWTKGLILVHCVVFAAQLLFGDFLTRWLALHPADLLHRGFLWQIATYTFLHGNLWHLVWNMLFLWWFGQDLESALGSSRFLRFYAGGVVVGALGYVAWALIRQDPWGYAVGASAGVMGVVVLCAFREPRRIIHLLLFLVLPVPIQLRFLAMVYVAGDVIGIFQGAQGVAHAAHLGGAAWAALYWVASQRIWGGVRWPWPVRLRRRGRLKLVEPPQEGPSPEMRAEVDRLLTKISRSGIDSLSPSEKDYLARASREFRH